MVGTERSVAAAMSLTLMPEFLADSAALRRTIPTEVMS